MLRSATILLVAMLTVHCPQLQAAPDANAAPSPRPASGPGAPPSTESLRKLFATMHTSSLLDNMLKQIDAMTRAQLTQRLAGKPLNDAQRKILQDAQAQVQALVRAELTWDKLEPLILEVYRNNLTQREVDGMLKFYESESGRAVIDKMPLITQGILAGMQTSMKDFMPKVEALERHTTAQVIEAGGSPPAAQDSGAPPSSASPPAAQPQGSPAPH
jgi:hypothetical protein